jgi:hypothetical protein
MKKIDRMREKVTILPTSTYLSKMHDAGWSLVALEWEREVESSSAPVELEPSATTEEIPFGLRISADCHHLEDDPLEMQTLKFLAEMIVQDISFTSMADALNVREYRTRDGRPWSAAGVFKLTPRLIDVAPRILSGTEWESGANSCPTSPGILSNCPNGKIGRRRGERSSLPGRHSAIQSNKTGSATDRHIRHLEDVSKWESAVVWLVPLSNETRITLRG